VRLNSSKLMPQSGHAFFSERAFFQCPVLRLMEDDDGPAPAERQFTDPSARRDLSVTISGQPPTRSCGSSLVQFGRFSIS